MFLLYFFELVKRIMEWTGSPVSKVLSFQEHRMLTMQHNTSKLTDDQWRHAAPVERVLHDYLVRSYPPYFGLNMCLGRAAALCNHVVFEQY